MEKLCRFENRDPPLQYGKEQSNQALGLMLGPRGPFEGPGLEKPRAAGRTQCIFDTYQEPFTLCQEQKLTFERFRRGANPYGFV